MGIKCSCLFLVRSGVSVISACSSSTSDQHRPPISSRRVPVSITSLRIRLYWYRHQAPARCAKAHVR